MSTPLPPNNESPSRPATRQELYDRLRQAGTREEFILSEMKRLGFWPNNAEVPSVAEELIHRESALVLELRALYTEKRRAENEAAMLRELRKKRMAESRKKRAEAKLKREQERKDRSAQWQEYKSRQIPYLGENVSGGLNQHEAQPERLARYALPTFNNAAALAAAMGISVGELRFLTFSREVSRTSHYKRFLLPKKTGGHRLISAPMPRLKDVQYWILAQILEKVKTHPAAHGFIGGHSIVSNALPHVGATVVINLDLKDFFPSITYPRVKGVFRSLGYSESVSTLLALACTEPDVDEAEMDGETWYLAKGERHLPQGAPTSPAITNILCARLDSRLQGLAKRLGFTYTRYADDLSFSASGEGTKHVNQLMSLVSRIVESEDFRIHPDKTRVMRKGSRKEVTGIVVNDKPSVDRTTLRRFRALLHQIEKEGIASKRWGHSDDVLASIQGYARFVAMVDPAKGQVLQAKVKALIEKYEPGFSQRPRKSYPKGERKWIIQPIVQPVLNQTSTTAPTSTSTTSTEETPAPLNFVWKLLGKMGGKKK